MKDKDTGLVIFSNFFGLDPAGNYLEYDNNTVQSLTTVTMDTSQPSVTSVELSTDNILSGTLYDNVTGLARDNDSVVKANDNVTLKFITSERVFTPKVKINGEEKAAIPQKILGSDDKSGRHWKAVYNVKDNDSGVVSFSDFNAKDNAGNSLEYSSSAVLSPKNGYHG